jgi:acyl-coenzyme A thioesterase PaaI-like protein
MPESLKSRAVRFLFNLYPCYRRTGVLITYVAADFDEVRIKLPLNWRTRGYNGTTFGGSMYACVDPVYVVMLSLSLGKRYIAWDKAATIEFRKPGRETLYSTFRFEPGELDAIRNELEVSEKVERIYDVDLCDAAGAVHAHFRKTLQIRKRRPLAPKS